MHKTITFLLLGFLVCYGFVPGVTKAASETRLAGVVYVDISKSLDAKATSATADRFPLGDFIGDLGGTVEIVRFSTHLELAERLRFQVPAKPAKRCDTGDQAAKGSFTAWSLAPEDNSCEAYIAALDKVRGALRVPDPCSDCATALARAFDDAAAIGAPRTAVITDAIDTTGRAMPAKVAEGIYLVWVPSSTQTERSLTALTAVGQIKGLCVLLGTELGDTSFSRPRCCN